MNFYVFKKMNNNFVVFGCAENYKLSAESEQATGNRQQATGNRQQATGNRQQATGNYEAVANCVNPLTAYNLFYFQYSLEVGNGFPQKIHYPCCIDFPAKKSALKTLDVTPHSLEAAPRCFCVPLLIETDLMALGIKISDRIPADYDNKEYYGVIAQSETFPANPKESRNSFSAKRKKDRIHFEFGDSGKTACFAVRMENKGKKGHCRPLVSALIL